MNIEHEIEKKANELIKFRRRYSIVLTILEEKELRPGERKQKNPDLIRAFSISSKTGIILGIRLF